MTRLLLTTLLIVAGCSTGDDGGPRYTSNQDGISFARPAGWDITRERATLLLHRRGRAATIAIRTIERAGWSEPRTADNVVPAVASSLRALPRARVSGPAEVDGTDYPAVAFDVDFAPPGHGHYQRRHVTLLSDAHVIHVFLVTPAGQLDTSRRELDIIVKSIREEG